MNSTVNKAVLAYSGGLDSTVILLWLRETYGCEIVTFTADIGQGEEIAPARVKAEKFGIKEIYIEDLCETFVADYVWPMLRANAVYEHEYLLGTCIARPLIAKRQVEIAVACSADAVCHGATGKGNDQVRFELGYLALSPDIKIIAPWREWDLNSREKLLAYAKTHALPVEHKRGHSAPYSMDANMLHISYEGGELEDPSKQPSEKMWLRTRSLKDAPDDGEDIEIGFSNGNAITINGEHQTPAALLQHLNIIAGKHGIGRKDIVENRYIGMKSRGCYETPGGSILHVARKALETITLDREVMRICADLMPRYASLIYNGYWWSPERKLLQILFDEAQKEVNGTVRLHLYKGNIVVGGRDSDNSLFDHDTVTFEEDGGVYQQADAGGFIRLNALRLRLQAKNRKNN